MSKFPKANITIEKRAKSVDEAIAEAVAELGVSRDKVSVEIVQEGSKGFLGLGAKEAVVRVSVEAADSAAPVATEAPAKVEPEKTETVKAADTAKAAEEPAAAAEKAVSKRVYSSPAPEENAKNFISDVLSAMGIEVSVSAVLEDDVIKVNLEGDNMGIVIGKRGDTLDSLQYLTSLVVNRNVDERIRISIDTENYREKRSDALIALSNRLAAKVARSGKKFTLEPMNPYERRIIHSNLQDNEDVTTFSIGQEPYRKVVISPKNPRPYGKRGGYNKNRKSRSMSRGGYRRTYDKREKTAEKSQNASATYKADFKPQQHKAEYKNFEEYLAAHSKD